MIKYWIKIVSSDHTILKTVYHMLRTDATIGNTYNKIMNWAAQIKNILDNSGLSEIRLYQDTISINFDVIKYRILVVYKQNWHTRICNSNRLSSYILYKDLLAMETYLETIHVNKFRVSLSKFRLSSHDLAIEKGRYNNINRKNRLCTYCNMNVIENDFHFLLVCAKNRHLRIKYFKPYFCQWPNVNKFKIFMSSQYSNTCTLLKLSKYIYFAFRERSNQRL